MALYQIKVCVVVIVAVIFSAFFGDGTCRETKYTKVCRQCYPEFKKRHSLFHNNNNCVCCNASLFFCRCQAINYPEDLPTASIIICFYNEHYPTLLRTIHSVIDRTPSALLEEIILVDDYSDIPELHSNLMEYIEKHLDSRIKLFKTERREGLIRARMFGARKARGDVSVLFQMLTTNI